MGDPTDVRIPLPRETTARRKINAVVLTTILSGLIVLGFAWVLIPRVNQKVAAMQSRAYQVTVLNERPMTREEIASTVHVTYNGRPERFTGVDDTGKEIVFRTPDDYRRATGKPGDYHALVVGGPNSTYAGKLIRIDGAMVDTVPGDKIFSIGPTPEDSLLVKMDEPTAPGNQKEWELVVKPGDLVWIVGRIEKMPSDSTLKKWGLTDAERSQVGRQDVYLKARLVQDAS